MSLTVTGKITQILDIEKGTSKAGKEWQKQSVVIDNGDEYNPTVCISFFGDEKIKVVSNYKVGDSVSVDINLSSREFNTSWYHNVDGWRITKQGEVKAGNTVDELAVESDLPF